MRLGIASRSSLSVRTRDAGGPVGAAVATPADVIRDAEALTLLIHGFAVTLENAVDAYDLFREELGTFGGQAVDVYWPGDWGMFGVTQASYPLQRRRALDSVTEIADFIAAELDSRFEEATERNVMPRQLELRIVAHSLGCLVALELVKLLNRPKRELKISLLVLMAAAVPQYRLAERDLGRALGRIAKVRVYRSYWDMVLALAFPIGELPHHPFPEGYTRRAAIGRYGCGRTLDNVVEEKRSCGHSGYWPDRTIGAAIRRDHRGMADAETVRKVDKWSIVGRRMSGREVTEPL